MLNKSKKIMMEGKCEVDGKEVKGFRAVIDCDKECNMGFHHWEIDKDACKNQKKTVRKDQSDFEDWAYLVQEEAFAAAAK